KDRTTIFTFLGLTDLITMEDVTGGLSEKKTYTYDAYDHRISMVDDPAGTTGPKTYTYGYDVHGSVSTLLDDSNATVKATYGYDAYGSPDETLTAGEDVATGRDVDPLNAYRYTGRRMDTGSGSLDMGARRFGPDSQSFLQPDQYGGALANLGLSMDPLTGNRYSLAGGNPVGFVEVDGHTLNKAAGGGGMRIPGGPESGDPRLPDAGNAEPQVNPGVAAAFIADKESENLGEPLAPQCYYEETPTYHEFRELIPQCQGAASLPGDSEYWFKAATGVSYSPGWEPPTELESAITMALLTAWIPGAAIKSIAGGVKAWRAWRGAKVATGAGATVTTSAAGTGIVRYSADFALRQLTRGGTAKASELVEFAASQGWKSVSTATGPLKFVDENGILRLTIKSGSSRAPGSNFPHVEIRNALGQRIDPSGGLVTRTSPGNHTPISWDL
ncbi:MAG TPA: RHS repeat-associated core domain-containing protein, partial [Actinomycetota bacterium]|nr:RHS repeat-associated core domain-containing protein [Actinomycetota bacterium]